MVEEVERKWAGIEDAAGLPPYRLLPSVRDEALSLLELDGKGRQKLTPGECAEAVLVLSQYGSYVHRFVQRAAARVKFVEDELGRVIAPVLCQYDQYMKVEDKRRLAVRENPYARELEGIRITTDALRERSAYLTQRIHEVAEAFRNLSFTRQREREVG